MAFDALRPHTTALWRDLDEAQRGRFLRHLRPYWEVHRHRMAPDIADRLDGWIAAGAVTLAAGRLTGADASAVTWRVRGETVKRRLREAVLINCSGPDADIAAAPSALLQDLLASGQARPDPLRLGLDTQGDGRLIEADGTASPTLHAIGPLTRPAFWEAAAVPDLRNHAAALAAAL